MVDFMSGCWRRDMPLLEGPIVGLVGKPCPCQEAQTTSGEG